MSKLATIAVTAAVGTSGIAVYDAIHHGVTGDYSAFADGSGLPWLALVGDLVHGVNYAALGTAVLLLAHAPGTRPTPRWVGRALTAVLAVLAVMFLVGQPFTAATGIPVAETAGGAAVGGTAFLLMFALSFVLGLVLLRRPERRATALTLIAVGPLLALTVVLGVLGSGFAHPAYAETAVNLGLASLAFAPRARTHRTTSVVPDAVTA